MRINGRLLRPSTLNERRVMLSLGMSSAFRCPRSQNIFAVARRIRRLASGANEDRNFLRSLAKKNNSTPPELPDSRADEERAA